MAELVEALGIEGVEAVNVIKDRSTGGLLHVSSSDRMADVL